MTDLEAYEESKWWDHPQVKELLERSSEISGAIEDFKLSLQEVASEAEELEALKTQALEEYRAKMTRIANKASKLDQDRHKINLEMQDATRLRERIRTEVVDTISGLDAHEELLAAQEEWNAILASQEWLWIKSIFDFQKIGSEFIASALHRDLFGVLLADQMGLGKTLQATAAINLIQYTPDFEDWIAKRCPRLTPPVVMGDESIYDPSWYSVLWLCPNAIKASTMREIAKWSEDLNVIKLEGNAEERANIVKLAHSSGMVLVASYEQLRQRNGENLTQELFEVDWPVVVTDEAHKYKNPETSTFMNVEQIAKNAGFFVPMTGTPIMNRPGEFWAMLHMLTLKGKYSGKFDTYEHFEADYLHVWGSSNGSFRPGEYDKLVNSVSDMVLRRRKDEVLKDLPEKIREIRYVDLMGQQRIMYDEWRDRMFLWLDSEKTDFVSADGILAQLTRLRQIALLPAGVKIKQEDGSFLELDCWESAKIEEAMGVVEELLEADEKVLIFSNFNEPLRRVKQLVEEGDWTFRGERIKAEMIIGGVHEVKRDEIATEFNDPDSNVRVICGNITAMGTGLNLQGACSHSIFLDLFWNPATNEQAEDRLHRQGQKNNVTIHIIQAENTVDAFIAGKLEEKAGIIQGVIERDELRQALRNGLI